MCSSSPGVRRDRFWWESDTEATPSPLSRGRGVLRFAEAKLRIKRQAGKGGEARKKHLTTPFSYINM
jgi:hypothetical protein